MAQNQQQNNLNNNLQYKLSGEDEKCVQIILEVNDSILVNSNTICWMSDQITVEKIDSFFSFFLIQKQIIYVY